MAKSIIIIGPAHPLRGGLASFNQRLCKEFTDQGYESAIYSFSLQYPSFLFPGTTQYADGPAPEGIKIFSRINSINPLNWIRVGKELKRMRPDILVVRYWLPFMGPALGTILGIIRKNQFTKIIAITDNVLPHEKRTGDIPFTKYFLGKCDAFITMSKKVMEDLRKFEQTKPAIQVLHPLYDNFGAILPKDKARQFLRTKAGLSINGGDKVILFFGFIRKYKGLDILLEAMADPRIRAADIRLMVAGEFYESAKDYEALIRKLKIESLLIMKTDFIPDEEVRYYLCASDLVVQPYRNATQSGVTPLAYYFEKPMVVSNVGGLPALVPDGKAGLVAEPNPTAFADAILRFYELGEAGFIPHLRSEKQQYSWQKLVESIFDLAHDIQK